MSERKYQWKVFIQCFVVIIFALLFSLGGLEGYEKWLRRFLAPTILIGGMYWSSRDLREILQLPFTFASLSLGYGADTLWSKILRRFIYGAANGVSFNLTGLWTKKFLWSGFHFVLTTGTCIILGVWNPLHARAEEFFIGLIIGSTIFNRRKVGE